MFAGFGMGLGIASTSIAVMSLSRDDEQGRNASSLQLGDALGASLFAGVSGSIFAALHPSRRLSRDLRHGDGGDGGGRRCWASPASTRMGRSPEKSDHSSKLIAGDCWTTRYQGHRAPPAFPDRAAWGTVNKLRAWQEAALKQYFEADPQDFLAVATPGAGKTSFALTLAANLLARRLIDRIIIVAPTEHLKTQWAEAADKINLAIDPNFGVRQGKTSRTSSASRSPTPASRPTRWACGSGPRPSRPW